MYARLDTYSTVDLTPTDGPASVDVPGTRSWWVPTHTTMVRTTGKAALPVNLDLAPWTGAPDFIAGPGTDVSTTASATQLSGGAWETTPAPAGPLGGGPVPKNSGTVTAIARTPALDPSVTAQTGQFWKYGGEYHPL